MVEPVEAAGIWVGIAGFGISILVLIIEIRKTYFTKPKLKIHFENDPSIDTSMYRRELEFFSPTGQRIGLSRKYLKVLIRNIGNSVAHRCKAELRLKAKEGTSWVPDSRQIQLIWNGPSQQIDIGAKVGREPLMVLMSDSRLQTATPEQDKPYALAATFESYTNEIMIRAQDALGHGDYEGTLTVTCDEGVSDTKVFDIHVGNDWHDLEMQMRP